MERLSKTLLSIREKFKIQEFYLNHCTGNDAYFAFRNAIGSNVKFFPAGAVIEY